MMEDIVYAGQMNRQVELFENTAATNDSGESISEKSSLGKRMVKRIDALGKEEEADGRLLGLAVCRFQMRFDTEIAAKASQLIVSDFDGDWDVVGPMRLLDGRKRYMELRCRKRGEN